MHGNNVHNQVQNAPKKGSGLSRNGPPGPVSWDSLKFFGPEKPVVKMQSACFEKLIFWHVFNVRKVKKIAKVDGLERRRCEDRMGIVTAKNKPENAGARL